MDQDLTRHVLEVLAHGLALKERVTKGESLLLDAENAKLKQMLWADGAVRGHLDYGDTAPRPVPYDYRDFLGARYALACWLDEIFISDATCPWAAEWKEKSLEAEIFGGGQERAWRFWSQAELAEKRPGAGAVETYLWCVMLGFRGAPRIVDPKEWGGAGPPAGTRGPQAGVPPAGRPGREDERPGPPRPRPVPDGRPRPPGGGRRRHVVRHPPGHSTAEK
ncbi:DotU family type IV/VI secretion system protein [Fimbriiglobus ruber]|uniref:Type IV / VI secretion system DotU domain-containing protein n=1 Tax=Fimbriiglobus ruber TaxID=1908690 RepID=A0A225DE51_9BACT|nr:DotU family type IV/VI secretion system protein [Fimbriiglobus ruber]OWK37914.1 hypothetical protein FRUB_07034 [Fimbriiglobus ruber]